jgi:hypothetical protein
MAVIYYPKNQLVYIRDQTVSASNYESILLNVSPNTVLYFDTQSLMQSVNALLIPITASWALTASLSTVILVTSSSFASSSFTASYLTSGASASYSNSSSYAVSASYAVNGGGGGNGPYTLITASGTNVITMDFTIPEAFINLTSAALYSFTASNPPISASVSNTTLFISHSVTTATSSLSFPSNWVFLGSTPTYITNSRVAMLTLKAYGPQYFVGAYANQF